MIKIVNCTSTGQYIIGACFEYIAQLQEIVNFDSLVASLNVGNHLDRYIHTFGDLLLRQLQFFSSFNNAHTNFLQILCFHILTTHPMVLVYGLLG